MSTRTIKRYTPSNIGMNAKATTGVGNAIYIGDFRHVTFNIGTADNANMTIKFYGSTGETPPAFSSAQSATNRWSQLDYSASNAAGVITDGDTGIVFSGTDGNVLAAINRDGFDWVAMAVTARSAGSVTANMVGYSD